LKAKPKALKGAAKSLGLKRRFMPRKFRKWKEKPQDAQIQYVIANGRRMRCITKADGRKIYRAPRKYQDVQ